MTIHRPFLGLATSAVALLVGLAAPSAHAEPGDGAFYFFGDSALSMGNFYEATGIQHDPRYSRDGFVRRESNGPVWAEILLNGDLDTALDPARLSSNVNYAFSGAQSGCCGLSAPLDEGGAAIPIGIHSQIDLFEADLNAARASVSADDIFFVAAGGNDVLDRVFAGDDWDQIGIDIANNSAVSIQRLADAGAKTIFFETVPDVDVIPPLQTVLIEEQRMRLRAFTGEIRDAQRFAYDAISESLPEDARVVSLPLDQFITYATDNATEFGFATVTAGCIDGQTDALCSANEQTQNSYLFWDDVHLTTAAQALQADFYGAFMDAGLGDAGRAISRLPDYGLLAVNRVADTNLSRLLHADQAEIGWRAYLDGDGTTVSKFQPKDQDVKGRMETHRFGGGLEYGFAGGSVLGFSVYQSNGDLRSDIAGAFSASAADVYAADIRALSLSGYGRWSFENAFLDAAVSRSSLQFDDLSRATGAPLIDANGQTDGVAWRGDARAGFDQRISGLTIRPYASISYTNIDIDGYAEEELGTYELSLIFDDQSLESLQAGIGGAIYLDEFEIVGQRIQPWARAGYSRELSDNARTFSYEFADNWSDTISIQTAAPARDKFDLAAGLRLHVLGPVLMDLSYERTFANDQEQFTNLKGALTVAF